MGGGGRALLAAHEAHEADLAGLEAGVEDAFLVLGAALQQQYPVVGKPEGRRKQSKRRET